MNSYILNLPVKDSNILVLQHDLMLHRDLARPHIRQRIQIVIHPLKAADLAAFRFLRYDRAPVGQLGATLGTETRAAQF